MHGIPRREILSGISGSISLTAWVFVLVPQLWENYRGGSAHGISMAFLTIWFIGDVTNLIGSSLAHLVPTVVALAVYFCIADAVLLCQCLYYRMVDSRRAARKICSQDAAKPLLPQQHETNLSVDAVLRGSDADSSDRSRMLEQQAADTSHPFPGTSIIIVSLVSVLVVCSIGTVGWVAAWRFNIWTPSQESDVIGGMQGFIAVLLGYFSAICYLGARLPQIMKNYHDQSCDGLSHLFFVLSLIGNISYGGEILFHSSSKRYVVTNLPWLVGSLGTMVFDIMIFVQFFLYRKSKTMQEATTET